MLKLFEPKSKVQKDRRVVRETDTRMAKYSRRGLISNLLVYTLALVFGQQFVEQYHQLATVLSAGLFLITLMRAYLLFRFDAIYPRAPAAWRNKYFAASLLGAFWWGLIMISVTLALGMEGEALLLWLYTVVFFSVTAHAFAPYHRFLSIYQAVGLVPAALATFFVGELVGVIYGSILLMFFVVLNHHCELIAENYWKYLEATHALARNTESIEAEKRGTKSLVRLSNEYLALLSKRTGSLLDASQGVDFVPAQTGSALLRTELEDLHRNIDDFQKVFARELKVSKRTFNVRHYLQYIGRDLVERAEGKGLELELALSPAVPLRLVGDANRLGQIARAVLSSTINQAREGVLLVEVEFLREYEASGDLHVTIVHHARASKRRFFHESNQDFLQWDLELVLVKGVAEALGGSLGVGGDKNLRFRLPMQIAELDAPLDYLRLEYKNRPVLLVHYNGRWLDHKRLELEAMGFVVQTANSFKKAVQMLLETLNRAEMIECVIFTVIAGRDDAVNFSNELRSHNELRHIHQFVIGSDLGQRYFSEGVTQSASLIHYVRKPSGIFEFDIAANRHYSENFELKLDCEVLWVALGRNSDSSRFWTEKAVKITPVGESKLLLRLLKEDKHRLVVIESTDQEDLHVISSVRVFEHQHHRQSLIPIVGVGPASMEEPMLAVGVDHFVDLERLVAGDASELRYWVNPGSDSLSL